MTSNHHVPYVLGYTRTTMGVTERSEFARRSKSEKSIPSSSKWPKVGLMIGVKS